MVMKPVTKELAKLMRMGRSDLREICIERKIDFSSSNSKVELAYLIYEEREIKKLESQINRGLIN